MRELYKKYPMYPINAHMAGSQIDPFVAEVAKVFGVSVPWNDHMTNKELNAAFQQECLRELRAQQERLIAYSWETNPERMGR